MPHSSNDLIFLGIDPGMREIGYGAALKHGGKIACLAYGVVQFEGPGTPPYPDVFRSITKLLRKHRPHTVAVETLYVQRNPKRALALAETRGVIVLACQKAGVNIKNIPPATVKRIVAGYGRATKSGVSKMVQFLLDMDRAPAPDDAADALALAIAAALGYSNEEL